MKRCRIALPEIRISRPGFDVDTAPETGFLLHENFLFSQPYFFTWVQCPFAGNTSNQTLTETVNVNVPSVTADPIVILYPQRGGGVNSYPGLRSEGNGNNQSGFVGFSSDYVLYNVVNAGLIQVQFQKSAAERASLNGCFMVLMKGD